MLNDLIWDDRLGYGHYPVDPADWPYDAAYFSRYQSYEDTPVCAALNAHRVRTAAAYAAGAEILDFGIGCGSFIRHARAQGLCVYGYDVNPAAVAWLRENLLYRELASGAACVTFWDSFEHVARPDKLLALISGVALISIPIFRGPDHARASRHFRPAEHYWYFTRDGLVGFMRAEGFNCVFESDAETQCGREDILTFAFVRTST